MSKTFCPYEPRQDFLLPASMREWLPTDHLDATQAKNGEGERALRVEERAARAGFRSDKASEGIQAVPLKGERQGERWVEDHLYRPQPAQAIRGTPEWATWPGRSGSYRTGIVKPGTSVFLISPPVIREPYLFPPRQPSSMLADEKHSLLGQAASISSISSYIYLFNVYYSLIDY